MQARVVKQKQKLIVSQGFNGCGDKRIAYQSTTPDETMRLAKS